jgi:hypothetical protein
MQPSTDLESEHWTIFWPGASSPPLSLSLPHKGGGNGAARTFAPHAMCLRLEILRTDYHAA